MPPAPYPSAPPVHPRVCGERTHIDALTLAETGSSPRVRGTHLQAPDKHRTSRFIPACAGNADIQDVRERIKAVHPRVCGERLVAGKRGHGECGSSPRVRGTRADARPVDHRGRFIPACAGNAAS